jgi:fermentation-respiration switch protein FrsA (DUF1100 family)
MPCEEWRIKSDDGLTLVGRYYEFDPSAPVEILLHGYRGSAEIDLSGGMQRCFAVKHNALLVDLRGCGKSGGSVITFGLKECRDTLNWLDEINRRLAPKEIYIGGVSMGATTALLAGGSELPDNVKGIVADCGFHSAREIIRTVIGKIGLPVAVFYPLVRLGGLIFGGFDIDTVSAEEAVKRCRVPVLFFHGEDDDYVPCEMSRINFNACNSKKMLVTMKGAGHGLCYLVDKEKYMNSVREFFGSHPQ